MDHVQFETERFWLRKIGPEDIETLFGYWSDERVTEYMNVTFTDVHEAEEMVDLLNGLVETGEGIRWAIADKTSAKVLGSCGFHNIKSEHRRAEIGYELGREFWEKGVLQEVMQAVLEYCFNTMDFNRIEAFVMVGNTRSANALKRLGFHEEGTLRDYEFTRGQFRDQIIFSLLKREWHAKVAEAR